MSMHLEGPWLTTTGKKKGKRKFASAEHARKAREAQALWEEMVQKYSIDTSRRRKKTVTNTKLTTQPEPYRRDTGPRIPSLNSGLDMGPAFKKEPVKYTGTLIKGIATMHKSNAVPIINDQEAKDIAKMRR